MMLSSALLLCWLLAVAWMDARFRRIPNVLSLGACALGATVLLVQHHTVLGGDWVSALQGLAAALALTLPGYALRKLGAGDVKLLMAMALMSDLTSVLATFAIGAIFSLGLALAMPVWRTMLRGAAIQLNQPSWLPTTPEGNGRRHIPYGIGLALGFAAVILFVPANR